MDDVDEGMRASLQNGYTVYVDSDWIIAESNEENNSFEVPASHA